VQLDPVVADPNILLVLGFSENFEDEDEEERPSSAFSPPVSGHRMDGQFRE